MEEISNVGLLKKLASVMADVANLPKNGRNTFHNYDYVLDADVLKAVHDAFVEHGVVMISSMLRRERNDDNTVCDFIFTLYDIETGASIGAEWKGEANDKQDKGTSKAAVGAVKYFLLKTFLISTGDLQADADRSGTERTAGGPQKAPTGKPGLYVMPWGAKMKGKTLAELDRGQLEWVVGRKDTKPDRPPPQDVIDAIVLFLDAPTEDAPEITKGQRKYWEALQDLSLTVKEAEIVFVMAGKTLKDFEGDVDAAIAFLKENYDPKKE